MDRLKNFGDLPDENSGYESSKIVILPVPYDLTSTWIKGADKGPAAIIEASTHMELFDIETDSQVYTEGIFTAEAVDSELPVEDMVETVHDMVGGYLEDGKFVVVIGGEHSVSIGSAGAHIQNNPDVTVLQLDAHSDLRDKYEGSRFNHACVMARISEMCPVVQVGIRSMDISEKKAMSRSNIFFAEDLYKSKDWIEKVISKLSEKVYLTIDLDVFDPSVMPSTGTPEPGGLFWYNVLDLLRTVFENRNVTGFDVVELCPVENNKAPDFLAAKLIYKLLSYKFRGNNV